MLVAESGHSACVLDGLIYVIGGFRNGFALDSVHRFDPGVSTWSTLAPMTAARSVLQSFVCDGSIYVAGGWDEGGKLATVERYSVELDSWTEVSDMALSSARTCFGAATMGGPWTRDGSLRQPGGQGKEGTGVSRGSRLC